MSGLERLMFSGDAFSVVGAALREPVMTCSKCGETGHSWCGVAYVHEASCAFPIGPCDCIVQRLTRPLAGHSGACDKVTQATITGKTDARCSCGVTT